MNDESLDEALALFEESPCPLPRQVVVSLLDELCASLGYCLDSAQYDRFLAEPPTDPETFASQVMGVQDGSSDRGPALGLRR